MSLTSTATCMACSTTDLYNVFNFIPTLRQTKPRERPEAAICVRKSSARRVLHFTPLTGASSVLHRPANRVIHRLQLYLFTLVSHICVMALVIDIMLKLMGIALITSYVGTVVVPRDTTTVIKSGGTSDQFAPITDVSLHSLTHRE